jgi:hydroxymethylglutaryl-CoA reductase
MMKISWTELQLVGNSDRFDKDQSVIARHIANVFKEGELEKESNMQILHNTLSKYKPTAIYNLDVINNVFKEGELYQEEVCAKIANTTRHGE